MVPTPFVQRNRMRQPQRMPHGSEYRRGRPEGPQIAVPSCTSNNVFRQYPVLGTYKKSTIFTQKNDPRQAVQIYAHTRATSWCTVYIPQDMYRLQVVPPKRETPTSATCQSCFPQRRPLQLSLPSYALVPRREHEVIETTAAYCAVLARGFHAAAMWFNTLSTASLITLVAAAWALCVTTTRLLRVSLSRR